MKKSLRMIGLATSMLALTASSVFAQVSAAGVSAFGIGIGMSAIIAVVGLILGFGVFKVNPIVGLVAGLAVLISLIGIVLVSLGVGALTGLLSMPIAAGLIVFGAAFVVGDALSALF